VSHLTAVSPDAQAAASSIEEQGYALVENVLAPDEVDGLRRALVRQAAIEQENGIAARDSAINDGQRVYNLIAKSPRFVEIARHPFVLAVMEELLGPAFLLSNLTANIARPGRPEKDPARNLHHDVGFIDIAAPRPRPLHQYAIVGQVIWMLDDFTELNGATRIVPGSHLEGRWPDPADADRAVPALGPKGSALIFDGRLWHQTGTNETESDLRHALLAYYCVPWLRPQENWPAALPATLADTFPAEVRQLLGFEPFVTLGDRHPYPIELRTARD
jgi:ectoine hydroxylase-related dioxygenase (phytanoyl-CoA dioxygenase family)